MIDYKIGTIGGITDDDLFFTHIFDITLCGALFYVHYGLDLFAKVDIGNELLMGEDFSGDVM